MKYDVFGRENAAAGTVVLSGGLGGTFGFWRPQIPALAACYRVIAYDHRGTGANAGPLPPDYSIAAMAQDVADILDEAGIAGCHFVGHALGGLVGLELALARPQAVRSLVLVNAWGRTEAHSKRCFAARKALLLNTGVEAYVKAQPLFLYPAAWMSENAARIEADDAHGIAHFQGTDTLLKRIAALEAFDLTARLGEIAAPALVMATRDDILVPWTASQHLAAGLPAGRLDLWPEGGHGFSAVLPEAFNAAVLRFLSAHGPARA
ncbi:pyrimidine utilization protein D [Pseudoxanthobacter sp.]|uniref:pyrimidine utilization protein D n=1 Tax=Pseudoxanthobacter sp. TaxID=1925742 RepID=UPI002FDFC1D6